MHCINLNPSLAGRSNGRAGGPRSMSHALHLSNSLILHFLLLLLLCSSFVSVFAATVRRDLSFTLSASRSRDARRSVRAKREKWIFIKPFVCVLLHLARRDHYFIISSAGIGSAFFNTLTRPQCATRTHKWLAAREPTEKAVKNNLPIVS